MSDNYYEVLSAERLRRCYEIGSPRVQQYLDAEMQFVRGRIRAGDVVLELGCGYGRAMLPLAQTAGRVLGIDNSTLSLRMAGEFLREVPNCDVMLMDATALGFADGSFDLVFCIQNGISAFHVDPEKLIQESLRVVKRGGRVLFSSYSERFWEDRLEWFRAQAAEGLIGEIDWERTGSGVLVCRDGFTATTVSENQFRELAHRCGADAVIREVDGSSLFCELRRRT